MKTRDNALTAEQGRDALDARAYALEAKAEADEGTDAATTSRAAATDAPTAANKATTAATSGRTREVAVSSSTRPIRTEEERMTRYRFDVDFGFSDLTRWFQGPWQHERTVPETVSDACEGRLGWPEGVAATAILHDSLRLLESPLSTAEITALWQAATQGGYNLEYFGIDGRDWLRQIVEICTDRLRQVDAAYAAVVEWPAPASSAADAVLAALRAASASLEAAATSGHRPTVPGIVEALEKTVVQVDPDLGFRLFLRIMAAYWVPITEAEYARYAALGERFGYGEFHVDDVEFLTRLKGD